LRIFRRIFSGGSLVVLLLPATPCTFTFAQTSDQQSRVDLVRVQRAISDDPEIDQTLVATLPEVAAPTALASSPVKDEPPEGELQIAAIGPAMRPLVPVFNAMWPTRGEITTYFGEVGRYSPRGHAGLDVAAPEGTPILAIDDGEILKAYWNGDGYGGLVIIAHVSGYETWYGHLDSFSVAPGERVKRGQRIGDMGSTGFSTGPHLHFEVREDGQLLDPLKFLREADLKPAL
jgi:murein DD-endopeptidase MepM/ murein hydrolase activator NlpD